MKKKDMAARQFPIGIQTFSKLREANAIYIDKTDLIYKLANKGSYFLSRPRRFGKSLLISTFEAYFQGKKELFEGLAIEKMETEWTQYPVLHFDLSMSKYTDIKTLHSALNYMLGNYEKIYGQNEDEKESYSSRLSGLIRRAYEKTGHKTVVLVDEYDAPMLDSLNGQELLKQIHATMRDFYSPLKASDQYLRFVFLTGITKFSQLSIFSELNNLMNISMLEEYGSLCGITENEMRTQLKDEIQAMADKLELSFEDTCSKLKQKYDGYHFSEKSEDIYNPFSLLNALQNKKLDNYWFSTGTPTHLVEQIKRYALDPKLFDSGMPATRDMFDTPTESAKSPIPVLYQSGYLTIRGYNPTKETYVLGYPNQEVRSGFLRCLMEVYATPNAVENGSFLLSFTDALDNRDIDGALELMRAYISGIPYDGAHHDEKHYSMIFYLIFSLSTQFVVRSEERSAAGRADAVIETADTVYVFEFKLDGSAEEALAQIDGKGYLLPYAANGKRLVKVDVNFDKELRTIGKWRIEEA